MSQIRHPLHFLQPIFQNQLYIYFVLQVSTVVYYAFLSSESNHTNGYAILLDHQSHSCYLLTHLSPDLGFWELKSTDFPPPPPVGILLCFCFSECTVTASVNDNTVNLFFLFFFKFHIVLIPESCSLSLNLSQLNRLFLRLKK